MITNYWFPALPIFPQSDEAPTATEKIATPEVAVSVYPNPATDYITINGKDIRRVGIYSMNGVLQLDTRLTTSSSSTDDICHLPKGIYLVRVTTGQGFAVRKIIKK